MGRDLDTWLSRRDVHHERGGTCLIVLSRRPILTGCPTWAGELPQRAAMAVHAPEMPRSVGREVRDSDTGELHMRQDPGGCGVNADEPIAGRTPQFSASPCQSAKRLLRRHIARDDGLRRQRVVRHAYSSETATLCMNEEQISLETFEPRRLTEIERERLRDEPRARVELLDAAGAVLPKIVAVVSKPAGVGERFELIDDPSGVGRDTEEAVATGQYESAVIEGHPMQGIARRQWLVFANESRRAVVNVREVHIPCSRVVHRACRSKALPTGRRLLARFMRPSLQPPQMCHCV